MAPGTIFLDFSIRKLRQQAERISTCLGCLEEEQIWRRANDQSNSTGNLALHLCGNVRQWIIAGVGGAVDYRHRDSEFSSLSAVPTGALQQRLGDTVQEACAVLGTLTPERLTERVTIQGYDVTVLEAIYHVVEHFSGHTGQIIQQTKALTNRPLDFYAHLGSAHTEPTP